MSEVHRHPRRHWPRVRISSLLGLMAGVAVVSSFIGAGALLGVVMLLVWGFPTIAGALLALFEWPRRTAAMNALTGIVLGFAGLIFFGGTVLGVLFEGEVGAALVFALFLGIAWLPQYALAITWFDAPRRMLPEEPLPPDWNDQVARRLEAGNEHATSKRLSLAPERDPPSPIVMFGWRTRRR